MSIPRWQQKKEESGQGFEKKWDKLIAIFAIANLGWIFFDISYIPLRSFWINKRIDLYNLPSASGSFNRPTHFE